MTLDDLVTFVLGSVVLSIGAVLVVELPRP